MTKFRKKLRWRSLPRSKTHPEKLMGTRTLLEKNTLLKLKSHARKGYKTKYETHKFPYVLTRSYLCDFSVERPDGTWFFIETKGWFRPEDRSKMLAVKMLNPDADIRFLFPKDNKLNKNSNTYYSDWCVRHGFPYAIGELPDEWFE